MRSRFCMALPQCVAVAGCSSIGPGTVTRDRFDYVKTMSDSWKRQTLYNLVKLRYSDAPVFLDVDSVISSYTWEADVNLGATGSATRADSSVTLGASGHYSDQPTITYTPMTGAKFARGLMMPFSISTIFALLQNGYRADGVLRACIASVNGIQNAFGGSGSPHTAGREFAALITVFRDAQLEGRLDIRETSIDGKAALVLKLRPSTNPVGMAHDAWFAKVLGLNPEAKEYAIVQSPFPANDHEIAFMTRSMLQVLIDLASYIEVPERDVREGRVYVPPRTPEQQRDYPPLIRIRSSESEPKDTYASVQYRDHWFYMDDRDVPSKSAFAFLIMMFSLTESGGSDSHPILTVPTR